MPKNWSKYNNELKERANIFNFIPDNAEEIWYNGELSGNRGASKKYTDQAIEICLTVQETFRLPLRQTEGLLNAIFIEMGKSIRCPDYSVLSRRRITLVPRQIRFVSMQKTLCTCVDSSGFKTKGDGEWHREHHDPCSRREWTKVHIVLDYESRQFLDFAVTSSKVTDDHIFPELLEKMPTNTSECIGDGAYDKRDCYAAAARKKITPIVPPRYDAVEHPDDKILAVRNKAIQATRGDPVEKKVWKQKTGYHRRSLVENGFFRMKKSFGHELSARTFAGQKVQVALRINLLNIFMHRARK